MKVVRQTGIMINKYHVLWKATAEANQLTIEQRVAVKCDDMVNLGHEVAAECEWH